MDLKGWSARLLASRQGHSEVAGLLQTWELKGRLQSLTDESADSFLRDPTWESLSERKWGHLLSPKLKIEAG